MFKKKAEDEATFPATKELENPPPPPKKERAAPPIDIADSIEERAAEMLKRARGFLAPVGHFETNQAVAAIDTALEWLAKCEATDEP